MLYGKRTTQTEPVSVSKCFVLLHSSASGAEGRVLTGLSYVSADRETDLHTVPSARLLAGKVGFSGMSLPCKPQRIQ